MRSILSSKLSEGRLREGAYASDDSWGPCGAFELMGPKGSPLKIISSNADFPETSLGWEHVSVSCYHRCPNWIEMCFVKDLFWSEEETVIQFHPPKSEYVNNHPYCLHLWRDTTNGHRLPPSILVGIKDLNHEPYSASNAPQPGVESPVDSAKTSPTLAAALDGSPYFMAQVT